EFLTAVKSRGGQGQGDGQSLAPELIGQFGVGFYAVFMVADRVTLLTRHAAEEGATVWESTGDGSFEIGDGERADPGTTVTLHLKAQDADQGLRDFTDPAVIKEIVKRYSDFVAYPIRMKTWSTPPAGSSEVKVFTDETLNSMKAIWDRPKSEVTDEEYREFYRHISHDWHDPLRTIPVKIEGTLEAFALLYLPKEAPFDLYSPEMKRGLQLYVKRVFVMDECKDLMPPHLRFVKGVVDAHDLSLNVSREILQKDRQIQVIRKQLVKKVLGALEDMKRDAAAEYQAFWEDFGPVIKEGLLAYDASDKDKLLELVMVPSTAHPTQLTSLADYVGRMKEGQDAIYYLTGPTRESVARSPLLEAFVDKGYEVLLFSDTVDEVWLEQAPRFADKPWKSIGRGEVKLGSDEERKKADESLEDKQRQYADLLTYFRAHLQDEIKEVRLSSRLTSSPVCLVGDEHDMTPRMQRIMEQLGQKAEKVKRILELNPTHPLIPKLQALFVENKEDPRLAAYARLLLGQAYLAESGQLPDPAAFTAALGEVMLRAV
ncbi:MAG: molecular chaperone HtpG, partial [Myxococcales bacterium]